MNYNNHICGIRYIKIENPLKICHIVDNQHAFIKLGTAEMAEETMHENKT